MPSLLRRRSKRENELSAALTLKISNPNDFARLNTYLGLSKVGNCDRWKWYQEIPEVNYAIDRGADLAGHAVIKAYKRGPDGKPTDEVTKGLPAAIAADMYSPYGGVRHLVGSYFALRRITGEAHLIRNRGEVDDPDLDGDGVDGYDFISPDELQVEGDKLYRLVTPKLASGDSLRIEVAVDDYIGRVWNPSYRHVECARSPIEAIDTICEELYLLTLGLKSKLLNRIALSGLLFVPSEMSEVVPANSTPGEELASFHTDITINGLVNAMVRAVKNHDEPQASLPIIIRGPGINGEQIRWVTMDREILLADMELRKEAIQRILTGLDIQPETVSGMGDSNHWDAWAIMDQDVKLNTEPDLQAMMWSLNRMIMWPQLIEARNSGGFKGDPASVMLWYDLSDAIVPTNLAENARQASDRIAITDVALRRSSGFEETDAPDDLERLRKIGAKTGNAWAALYGSQLWKDIDWDEYDKHAGKGKTGPDPASEGDPSPAQPGKGSPGSPNDNDSDTPKSEKPQ